MIEAVEILEDCTKYIPVLNRIENYIQIYDRVCFEMSRINEKDSKFTYRFESILDGIFKHKSNSQLNCFEISAAYYRGLYENLTISCLISSLLLPHSVYYSIVN